MTAARALLLGSVCVGLMVFVAMPHVGPWLEAPAEVASNADVIVVLGGGGGNRISTGLTLYNQGMAPRLLLAGAEAKEHGGFHDLIDWRADLLVKAGVPPQAILLDRSSRNTWEEAVNALAIMQAAGWRKAIVVSDSVHMRRLSWAWQRASRYMDVTFVAVSSPPDKSIDSEWWRDESSRKNVLNEVVKLVYYYVAH